MKGEFYMTIIYKYVYNLTKILKNEYFKS